jgi:amino acid transporter
MKRNVGLIDRLVRLFLASALFYLGLFLYNGTALGVGFVVVGTIVLATALVGFCGLYRLLGIQTNQASEPM